MPDTGAHCGSSLKEFETKSSVFKVFQQWPVHTLVWSGLDWMSPGPKAITDTNKSSTLWRRFKTLFQSALLHTAQEKEQDEAENTVEKQRGQETPQGHTANINTQRPGPISFHTASRK